MVYSSEPDTRAGLQISVSMCLLFDGWCFNILNLNRRRSAWWGLPHGYSGAQPGGPHSGGVTGKGVEGRGRGKTSSFVWRGWKFWKFCRAQAELNQHFNQTERWPTQGLERRAITGARCTKKRWHPHQGCVWKSFFRLHRNVNKATCIAAKRFKGPLPSFGEGVQTQNFNIYTIMR